MWEHFSLDVNVPTDTLGGDIISCYHPLTAIWTGCYTDKGKKDYVIVSGEVDYMNLDMFKRMFKGRDYDNKALVYDNKFHTGKMFKEFLPVPCGRCIGCRLDYSRSWAVRCLLESKEHEDNQFITLTYDDAHLPKDHSVHKRDVQLFLKRLRKYIKYHLNIDNIKYYACGEYGDKSERPHYHLILFGLPLPDKRFLSCVRGNKLYVSDIIAKCWPYGIHSVGEVNYETAAYTARYVMKKKKGYLADYYKQKGIESEFNLMSRRPGIGLKYFEENYDKIYKTDEVIYTNANNQAMTLKPCSYYDKKFDLIDSKHLEKIKESRTVRAVLHRENVLKYNDFKDNSSYLEYAEGLKKESCKILKRSL